MNHLRRGVVYRLYNLLYPLFRLLLRIVSRFSPKVRASLDGRKNLFADLESKLAAIPAHRKRIWIHAASVGEFEQARPIIARLRNETDAAIIVSFLSVSGYEARKNFSGVDLVSYLPEDTPALAKRFVKCVAPDMLMVMRYDFWLNHLIESKAYGAKLLLVGAVLERGSSYFNPLVKPFYKKVFSLFDKIFTARESDRDALHTYFEKNDAEVSGDTRFDQVLNRAQSANSSARLTTFRKIYEKMYGGKKVLVAGSTWANDEALLLPVFQEIKKLCAMILVPHEIGEANLLRLTKLLEQHGLSFEFSSSLNESSLSESSVEKFSNEKILIVNEIGYLAELYSMADAAYVGGGFGVNVHNTLEPAAHGVAVVYGHHIEKSPEAKRLAEFGSGTIVSSQEELRAALKTLFTDTAERLRRADAAKKFVTDGTGATEKVLAWIQAQRL
jgi:3-deoxy-D-manno-octulosonic-acid transferase